MFDSLADRMKEDEHEAVSNSERYVRWAAIAVISILVFAGLYAGVHFSGM
jgi:hypothetical protein